MDNELLSAWIQWIGEAEKEATAPREPRHPKGIPSCSDE